MVVPQAWGLAAELSLLVPVHQAWEQELGGEAFQPWLLPRGLRQPRRQQPA